MANEGKWEKQELKRALVELRQLDPGHEVFTSGDLSTPTNAQRLSYLCDARGVATVFRIPVSVGSGVPGISVRQSPPMFHPGPMTRLVSADHIHIGTLPNGAAESLPISVFNRHALITGFTGTGKTVTTMYLLDQFGAGEPDPEVCPHRIAGTERRAPIPFLVIESTKTEYRQLMRRRYPWRQVQVITVGDESSRPLRLNPFQLLPGVRLESHIRRLMACFEASMSEHFAMPALLTNALYESYWETLQLEEEVPRRSELATYVGKPLSEAPGVMYPTLRLFILKLEEAAAKLSYQGELKGNVLGAIDARIRHWITEGSSKAAMFDTMNPLDTELLFNSPCVLELDALNEKDRALLTMFVLVFLREYMECVSRGTLTPEVPSAFAGAQIDHGVRHITVIEEAHNVMENLSRPGSTEVQSGERYYAVRSLANMIAEVRAYGEAIIIADQSPNRLAADARRNTAISLTHQLRDTDDRETIGKACLMTDGQLRYLAKAPVGMASFYAAGREGPTFVRVPDFRRLGLQNPKSARWVSFESDDSASAETERIEREIRQRAVTWKAGKV
ncbi:MAG: DUF853 family protein [Planctomycetes bacterium]|nr:DUF853 family protein [Planctomycetota bacterium]